MLEINKNYDIKPKLEESRNLSHVTEDDNALNRILTRIWRCSELVFLTQNMGTIWQSVSNLVGVPANYQESCS